MTMIRFYYAPEVPYLPLTQPVILFKQLFQCVAQSLLQLYQNATTLRLYYSTFYPPTEEVSAVTQNGAFAFLLFV